MVRGDITNYKDKLGNNIHVGDHCYVHDIGYGVTGFIIKELHGIFFVPENNLDDRYELNDPMLTRRLEVIN